MAMAAVRTDTATPTEMATPLDTAPTSPTTAVDQDSPGPNIARPVVGEPTAGFCGRVVRSGRNKSHASASARMRASCACGVASARLAPRREQYDADTLSPARLGSSLPSG